MAAASSAKPLRKAVLPVAGLGTRVLPATKAIPKEMLPVFDRPAIQYVVDEALAAGIEHIVFVTGRNKSAIEDYFDRSYELEDTLRLKGKTQLLKELEEGLAPPGSMSFVRQQAPLGLGHAVWCARDVVGDEPFAVLLPDMLVMAKPSGLGQMVEAYNKVGGNIIAVEPTDDPSSYGVIDPESRDGRIIKMKGMVEKPKRELAPSNLFITGRYILQPEIFDLLGSQGAGQGGEIQLTDAMVRLMAKQSFHAFEYDGRSYDCGSKIGYLEAVAAFALANEELGAQAAKTLQDALAKR
ncbi:MAG TPA: UTP--glucose-1-phosphate uridylyltransferase GalU [Caulobacterales bacterium]|nr:UTP--glucose-1-phosphate uridylyltransferase GalU [Caulobacterales bacterium]